MFDFAFIRAACVRLMPALFVAMCAPACNNYTSQPLCSDANAVLPPGITGVYTWSIQDENFNVTTQEFQVIFKSQGHVVRRSFDGDEQESRVCQIGGYIVDEAFNEKVQGYQTQRMYVTGMGITYLPMFYDRAALDAAAIPYKIFEVPQDVRAILGESVATAAEGVFAKIASYFEGEVVYGLMIDNSAVAPATVVGASRAGPVGITLLRK